MHNIISPPFSNLGYSHKDSPSQPAVNSSWQTTWKFFAIIDSDAKIDGFPILFLFVHQNFKRYNGHVEGKWNKTKQRKHVKNTNEKEPMITTAL